jgi:hypothetical protein
LNNENKISEQDNTPVNETIDNNPNPEPSQEEKNNKKSSGLLGLIKGRNSQSLSDTAKNLIKKKIILMLTGLGGGGCLLTIALFSVVLIAAPMIILGIIDTDSSSSSGGVSVTTSTTECNFTISSTPLTKAEYKSKLEEYASTHSKAQIFANNADAIYDKAKSYNINPELVIIRAAAEGYSPGSSKNNYWGMGCTNTGGVSACKTYSSFMAGVEAFLSNISKYDSLSSMMSNYSYIGDYWYNPGSSSKGGCYYANYIYTESNMPSRVSTACKTGNTCSGSNCVKTTDEDQKAYTTWQVEKSMAGFRQSIFGLSGNSSCSTTTTTISGTTLSLFTTDDATQLTSNLSTLLSDNGTSIEEYNNYIYANVKKAGLGTANGVVAAALSYFKYLEQFGYRPRYTWGGKYSKYGVNPTMGSSNLDCSGFVSWAIHNGGFKYVWNGSSDWGNAGTQCTRTNSSCTGKAGDLIWHQGHIMLIVGVEGDYYYIAEAASTSSGMKIKKQQKHVNSGSSVDKIVNMDSFYNNSSNIDTSNYPG